MNTVKNPLRKLIRNKPCLRIIEAVDPLEAMLAESICAEGLKFDGLWLSGLCHAAHKGLPDDGNMPFEMKLSALKDICRCSGLPVLIDCDTGGDAGELSGRIRAFDAVGGAAAVIEDKRGVKRNSLYGKNAVQTMEDIDVFSDKISHARAAASPEGIMIFARIESLIAGEDMNCAMKRAGSYIDAGAEGIVIHSICREASDVFEFSGMFRSKFSSIPLIMIPTVYNSFSFEELQNYGASMVIYANQLTRSACLAMEKTAHSILMTGSSQFSDENYCVPSTKILQMIEGDINDRC